MLVRINISSGDAAAAGAHSAYNALIRRLVAFERAASRALSAGAGD